MGIPQPHEHTRSTFEIRSTLWNRALDRYGNVNGSISIPFEARLPESPLIEMIWHGRAETDGIPHCPADVLWYMRFLKRDGQTSMTVLGPTTKAVPVAYREGDEFLGIRFKAGVFMPHLSPENFVNGVVMLPEATSKSFWLHGSAWEIPVYKNTDVFVDRLAREGLLVRDQVVQNVLQKQPQALSSRSVQYHFLRATGLTHKVIQQIERARRAAALIGQGVPVLETVHETGYCDQAHLTNSLKRFNGQTPAQIVREGQPG